jgi:CubicO group peptidase (beta-lactamase class C family)
VSIDTHVASMVLRAAVGMPLQSYMAEKLWSKIGAEDDAIFLTDSEGNAFALGGLNLRTRDYARFGQMMLGFGFFNGGQIVPAQWAADSVRPTSPVTSAYPAGYGYQWWVPKDAFGEFNALGIYGQYIYVNRPARVVIVKTSADRNFENDGAGGALIEAETVEMFRAIAAQL